MMKRNFSNLFSIILLTGLAAFTACTPEADQITTTNNTVPKGKAVVTYAVSVVSANDVSGRTSGLDNAVVTIFSSAGKLTSTTAADGIAVFQNLAPGQVTGYVSRPGAISVNFVADITPTTMITSDSAQTYYAASKIYLVETTSRLIGRLFGDFDLDDLNPASPDLKDVDNFKDIFMRLTYKVSADYPMGSGPGKLVSVSVDNNYYLVRCVLPSLDANDEPIGGGEFRFNNIPATENGLLTASLSMDEFEYIDPNNNTTFVFQYLYKYLDGTLTAELTPAETIMIPAGGTRKLGDLVAGFEKYF